MRNRFICLSAIAAVAMVTALQPAQAQTPLPTKPLPPSAAAADGIERRSSNEALVEGLIVKFVTPERYQVLDIGATAQAVQAGGATVAPVFTLTDQALGMLSAQAGVPLTEERQMSGGAFVLELPAPMSYEQADRIAKNLAVMSEVEYAEPDGRAFIALTPNDPRYADQWHYFAPVANAYGANLPPAWDITTGSASIVVAVLDTGIRFDHPDLAGRTVTGTVASGERGYDFITSTAISNDGDGRDGDPTDPGDWEGNASGCPSNCPSSWHGTHVAGTIGARSNNADGVAGINWNSRILPVRVLGTGGGTNSDIIDGMRWSAGLIVPGVPNNPNPAKVLNMSLGGSGLCGASYQAAINEITTAGSVIVVAAGNENLDASTARPGNCDNVITVAATTRTGSRASYSNFGSLIEISAPGGSGGTGSANAVLSTLNAGVTAPGAHNYQFYNGTSMAAPHVAGIASLMLSISPTLTPTQIVNFMRSTVTPFPAGSTCTTASCGSGIVNAGAALVAVQNAPPPPPPPASFKVFIPIAARQESAPPSGDLVNGNFEQGNDVGWQELSAYPGIKLVFRDEDLAEGVSPHGGLWAAWLGGLDTESSTLRQSVKVPAGATNLVFYQIILSDESGCSFDTAHIAVNGTILPGSATGLCAANDTAKSWVRRSVSLAAYAGQTITLDFVAQTDNTITSSWFLDDIAFSATP